MESQMNKVNWLVQSNFIDYRQVSEICDAVRKTGARLLEAVIIPFSDELGNTLPDDVEGTIIPYGSTSLTKMGARKGWKGCFFDEAIFRMDVFDLMMGACMLNSDQMIMSVRESMAWAEGLPSDEVRFIRPVKDLKEFNGTVTTVAEIAKWMSSVDSGNFSFDENVMVSISMPKKIYREVRWFVVDGKVVSGSQYKLGGQLLTAPIWKDDEIDTAQMMADMWLPHPCCVMDLADTPDGLKVVEYNCLNGSGFYANDIEKIVKAVTSYAKKTF